MAVTLYTSRVILQNLGVVDYGIYNVVNSVVFIFMFLNGTMSEATQRFIVYEIGKNNTKRLRDVFVNSINLHLLISCLVMILCETVGVWFLNTQLNIPEDRKLAAMWVYQLSILTAVISIMSVPYNAIIVSYEKMTAFAYISIIEVAFKLVVAYAISVVVWDRLVVYAILLCLVQLIIRFIYTFYCVRTFEVARYEFSYDKPILKEMVSFASWFILGFLAMVMNNQGVKIILNMFFGPVANASFGIGEQVQKAFTTFRINLQTAINPQITKTYAADNTADMHALIFASTKYSFFIFWMIAFPILLQTDYILTLWLKEVPEYTITFVRLLLLVALMHALANPLSVAIGAIGQLKKITLVHCMFSLFVLPVSYCLLKRGYSYTVPLYLYLISLVINYLISILFLNNKIGLKLSAFIRIVIVPMGTIVLISSTVLYFVSSLVDNFIINIVLAILVCCISIYNIGLNSSERKFIVDIIKKYGSKIFKKNLDL
ncbi:MATE family efflux transporter [Bacteroides sp.]